MQDVSRMARTYGQLGMVYEARADMPMALHWTGRTYQLARDNDLLVMSQVQAHLARLRNKYGEENFARWWREFSGEEPPANLDSGTEPPI